MEIPFLSLRKTQENDSYADIARNISNCGQADFNRAMRIARTEGHRVQNEAKLDTYKNVKSKGADIVKQWDATLDGKTRKSHKRLDGQIRELDEDFEIGGKSAPCPGKFNDPAEDCHCRCAMLQRARWALDEDELKTLQERAKYFGLDKSDSFSDFKEKYMNAVENLDESGIIKETENQLSELGKFKKRIRSDDSMSKQYYSVVKDKFSHGSDSAKEVFNKFIPENSVINSNFEGIPHYDPTTKKISMHYNSDLNGERGSCVTWFHEHGHMVDDMAGRVSNNTDFIKLLNSDYMAYMKAYGKKNGLKTFDKVQSAISLDLSSMREHSAVSDILQGLSKGNIQGIAGHRPGYWKDDSVICEEAFAHMFEAQFDDVRYAEMKKYFPNALAKFESILGGLI